MADDKKKPKIDLKARLGKTVQGTAVPGGLTPVPTPALPGSTPPPPGLADEAPRAPSAPPPAAAKANIVPPPSIKPIGIAPPAAITGGIALPSFNRPAAPKKEVVGAAAQTIKVEIGEEIVAERKKYTRFIALAMIVGAGAGGVIGFVAGGGAERSKQSSAAIRGSSDLEKEVTATAKKLKELDQILADLDSLDTGTYPKDLGGKLASINISFDDAKISGAAVGALPSPVIRMLLDFKKGSDSVNDRKDALKNMLSDKTQKELEQAWADVAKPPVKRSVIFKGGGDKPFVDVVNNKDTFLNADKWPETYKVVIPAPTPDNPTKEDEKVVTRWLKGDLTGVADKTMAMPIDPGQSARSAVNGIVGPLKAQAASIKRLIYGDNTPGHEVKGLLHPDENTKGLAEDLEGKLSEISLKK